MIRLESPEPGRVRIIIQDAGVLDEADRETLRRLGWTVGPAASHPRTKGPTE